MAKVATTKNAPAESATTKKPSDGDATTRIALIRGINVGTAKRVAMADLRELLSGLGYGDVRTLLNSGNAVFSTKDPIETVTAAIEHGLRDDLKVPARVLVRTRAQVVAAMRADPFGDIATDGSKHFLGFLDSSPTKPVGEIAELADDADTAPDIARLVDGHLYLWCPAGISKATFAAVSWDKKLGTAVTIRNWNTVGKLVDLAATAAADQPPA
jgi:uncharacterized protein (DUF1697 family)